MDLGTARCCADGSLHHVPRCPCSPLSGAQGLAALAVVRSRALRRQFAPLLLKLRQPRQGKALAALVQLLSERFTLPATAVLVPIPSWKRQRSNPLPQRIALGLGRPTAELLHRTRAGLSQHHLNRRQRQTNLIGAFQAFPMDKQGAHSSVWLVDDILTTGSTALAARQALEAAGHRVAGLICLGRTPARERRR